jgi:prepilin-type N-terminal cleavage/methylation domain-containing protein
MRTRSAGFSLVELLVSIGIVAVVLSLALPALSGSASKAKALRAEARCRQIAQALFHYAIDYADSPPVLGKPDSSGHSEWRLDYGTRNVSWFQHHSGYSLVLASYVGTWRDLIAPGNPREYPVAVHRGVEVSRTDYHLTNTLYASPAFFDWETMAGPSQFAAQRLSLTAFPSSKGLIYQQWVFHHPGVSAAAACCMADVPTPIAFFDGSVSELVMRRMIPGVINPYAGAMIPPEADPRTVDGSPVSNTRQGLLGRDR